MEHLESLRKTHLPPSFLIFLMYGNEPLEDTLNSLAVSFLESVIRLMSLCASSMFLVRPGRSQHDFVHRTHIHLKSTGYWTSPSSVVKLPEASCRGLSDLDSPRIGPPMFEPSWIRNCSKSTSHQEGTNIPLRTVRHVSSLSCLDSLHNWRSCFLEDSVAAEGAFYLRSHG